MFQFYLEKFVLFKLVWRSLSSDHCDFLKINLNILIKLQINSFYQSFYVNLIFMVCFIRDYNVCIFFQVKHKINILCEI